MMLSRAAEHLYWMSRYMERAEDTARLINAATQAQLDLPSSASFGWNSLLQITGLDQIFHRHYAHADESSVIAFLLHDERNPSAILSCIALARENSRAFRDVLPRESWEWLNDLYLYARSRLPAAMNVRRRFEVLNDIIWRRHALIGNVYGCMSHDEVFQFMRIGRTIECADMTSRILDVSHAVLLPQEEAASQYLELLWLSVLKGLSAHQMFRRHESVHTRAAPVIKFLLKDPLFPRSLYYCLSEIAAALSSLPNAAPLLAEIAEAQAHLSRANASVLSRNGLHEFIDTVQLDLNRLHEALARSYFRFEPYETVQQLARQG